MAKTKNYDDDEKVHLIKRASHLRSQGMTQAEACTTVGISESSYLRWSSELRNKGLLKDEPGAATTPAATHSDLFPHEPTSGPPQVPQVPLGRPQAPQISRPQAPQVPQAPVSHRILLALAVSLKRAIDRANEDSLAKAIGRLHTENPDDVAGIMTLTTYLMETA